MVTKTKSINPYDLRTARAAAEALGRIGDQRAVELLIEVLKKGAFIYDLMASAAEALGRLKNPVAIEPLIDSFGYDIAPEEYEAKISH